MFSIAQMQGGAYYANLAREDYHTLGGEPSSKWYGGAGKEFGDLLRQMTQSRAKEMAIDDILRITKGQPASSSSRTAAVVQRQWEADVECKLDNRRASTEGAITR